jgi:hypothetical protein
MNILIKLTCLVGLVIAPILPKGAHNHLETHPHASTTIEVQAEIPAEQTVETVVLNENH